MSRLKVLFFSYYWPPAGGPGVQRAVKFCKYLSAFGIDPIMVTLNEKKAHYPVLDFSLMKEIEHVETHKTDTWEPFSLAGLKGKKDEVSFFNSADVSIKTKAMRFLRGNLFIPDPRRFWKKYALRKADEIIKIHDIKAIITTGPPHSVHLIGLSLQKKYHIPWLADFRDPWSDIYFMKTLFRIPFIHEIDKSLEKKVLESADAVVCIGESLKSNLCSKSSKNLSEKIKVIYNGFDESDFTYIEKTHNHKIIISYVGTLAPKHRIENFLNALECLESHNFEFHVVGDIHPKTKNSIESILQKTPFKLWGRLSHDEAVVKTSTSDLLLLSIFDDSLEGSVPAKLFEYLGSKNPIICLGPPNGESANIIKKCQSGETFDFDDLNGMLEFLKNFPKMNIKPNIQELENFSRKKLTESLAKTLLQIQHNSIDCS
ncbi:MAG: glycosyltransferase family 4 protein [Cytophagales bacterium]